MVLFLLSAWPDPRVPFPFRGVDKLAHVGLYSILGAGLAYGKVRDDFGLPHVALVAIGTLYGGTDEWHQVFVSGRSPELGDWLADVVGVFLGYPVLLTLLARRARRLEHKRQAVDVTE